MSREKIDAALKKITDEAAALKEGDPCKVLISEYIENKLTNDRIADLILDESKKLSELNKSMWDVASGRKSGNGSYISDSELIQMADAYYGINEAVPEPDKDYLSMLL
jgi:hypothetical protein